MVSNLSYTMIICERPSDFPEIPFWGLNILMANLVSFWLKQQTNKQTNKHYVVLHGLITF